MVRTQMEESCTRREEYVRSGSRGKRRIGLGRGACIGGTHNLCKRSRLTGVGEFTFVARPLMGSFQPMPDAGRTSQLKRKLPGGAPRGSLAG